MKKTLISLDVGCVFSKRHHLRKGDIGIDLMKGMCDVVADAQYLPFREDCFDEIFLLHILEHLEDPIKCLRDCKRVAKPFVPFRIIVPQDASSKPALKRLVTEFPVAVVPFLRNKIMLRATRARAGGTKYDLGHKRQVNPENIASVVKITKINESSVGVHGWFGRRSPLRKLIKERYWLKGFRKTWEIEATNV